MEGMINMIAVPFVFRSNDHCSLVRVKRRQGLMEFHVTIMNGELEKVLYGSHIYKLGDGVLQAYSRAQDEFTTELQEKIGWAIFDYLARNPIRNDLVA